MNLPDGCGCGLPVTPYLVDEGDEKHVRYVCELHATFLEKAGKVTELSAEDAVVYEVMEL